MRKIGQLFITLALLYIPNICFAQSITVVVPNGGQEWEAGKTYEITWTSDGTSGSVKIEYKTSLSIMAPWYTIEDNTMDDGSYNWTIPCETIETCWLKVVDIDGDPGDASDNSFSLVEGPIEITSPVGGEEWGAGSTQEITWNSTCTSGFVNIEYKTSFLNTVPWEPVANNVEEGTEQKYLWEVPNTPSNSCWIKITDVDGSPVGETSVPFTILEENIIITSPIGGEEWEVGDTYDITWTSENIGTWIKIDYTIDDGANWIEIAEIAPNDGIHSWKIPNTPSENCRVRVIDADGSPSGISPNLFTICEPEIEITSPTGGEEWGVGSTQNITWNSTCTSGYVNIEYKTSFLNTVPWEPVVSNIADLGTHTWLIPNTPSNSCWIRITDVDGSPAGGNEVPFTILNENIIITSPIGGEEWEVGNTYDITWTSENISTWIKIDYTIDDGANWIEVSEISPNDHIHSWEIPNTPSENCRVRVIDADGSPSGISPNVFTICEPEIEITSPIGGEEWGVGSTQNITWNSTCTSGYVNIEYKTSFLNTIPWEPVKDNVDAQNGSYMWKVPNTPSNSCWIKITDVDGSPSGGNEVPFTILDDPTSVELIDVAGITDYALFSNYPNPFNPTTNIVYQIPEAGFVNLTVFNTLGKEIRKLVSEQQATGKYRAVWNGKDNSGSAASTGIYFCKIEVNSYIQTRKMILIK